MIAGCYLESFTEDFLHKFKGRSESEFKQAPDICPCQFALKFDRKLMKKLEPSYRCTAETMARAPFIILFFSLLANFLVPSNCKQVAASQIHVHSSLAGRREFSRQQFWQASTPAPTQAPTQVPSHAPSRAANTDDNIQLVCSATRYPTSCLRALLPDERSQYASTPQAFVEILIAIAKERSMQMGLADAWALAALAPTTNNESLTAASAGCMELLDLAAHYVQISHAAFATGALEDIQAWMSGALTQSNDCYYGLAPFRATLEFVKEMTERGNFTVELISNSLALVDATLHYGPDATLWRPPPATREQQLIHIDTENFPKWMDGANRALLVHQEDDVRLTPDVTVALDSSIQAAVDQAPSWCQTRYVIHIKAGVYKETVHIPKEKTNLMFLGDGSNVTIITGNLHVQSPGITTWLSATVAVNGAGFIARGIAFENTAGPEQHQAVALRVGSDQTAFQECSILGNQDSLYTHSLRQFYKDCTIAGTVDFIFGNSAAVFQTCHILVRPREGRAGKATTSIVTAQGRIDPGQETALVFQNCSVDGTPEYNALQRADPGLHRVYLGRPWKTYSRTVFVFTFFSLNLQPEGWLAWNGSFALDTLLDAEYGSYGPGAENMTQRIPWSNQLSLEQVQTFSPQRLLQADTWLPQTKIPYSPFV